MAYHQCLMFVLFLKCQLCTLGLLLDPVLLLDGQVTAVSRGGFYRVRLLCQLNPSLEKRTLTKVVHALDNLNLVTVLYGRLPLKMS